MDSTNAYLFAAGNNSVVMAKLILHHEVGNCWTRVPEKVRGALILNTDGETDLTEGIFHPS